MVNDMEEEDFPYEEDVQRNPYSIRSWLRYLDFKSHASPRARFPIFERALKELPGSYKLWHQYLIDRTVSCKKRSIDHKSYERTNKVFERALVTMSKMPRIWIMYCEFLQHQKFITRLRHTFDRALSSLPITQHKRIWEKYIAWIKTVNIPETATRIFRRYLKLVPEDIEDYIDYLISVKKMEEAAEKLVEIVNQHNFLSKNGKSKHQLWIQLSDIISQYPQCGKRIRVEPIIRQGLENFNDQVGRLWTALANFYIKQGNFEKARDIFEEAISSVMSARDFTHIWDGYTQFEDSLIDAYIHQRNLQDDEVDEEEELEFELRVARYEYLIDRRPLLLSSVMLRQNPHNVFEWHKRVKLYKNPASIIQTYKAAIDTVNFNEATGKPHTLHVNFAKFYEHQLNDIEKAREIFENATKAKFKGLDDLASVWAEYVEMELRNKNFSRARELIARATDPPYDWRSIDKYSNRPMQQKLFKSTKLWCLRADIEESLGSFQSTKDVYEKIFELHIATPQMVINYAQFLEENNYFEESFKAFEKGVHLFQFPYSMNIWLCYLKKFVERYEGTKLERMRDLFEQAIEKVPADLAKILYITYAEVEEKYGYARHAMNVYDRATRAVVEDDKFSIFQLYIARATEFFGVTRTREIYDKALQTLPEKNMKSISLQYADMECKLGEVDRARGIYAHASQFCDPRSTQDFWGAWREFEVRYGNEDTFREMLRIRRSVQAQYNTQVNFVASALNAAREEAIDPSTGKRKRDDAMEQLEEKALPATVSTAKPLQLNIQPVANTEEIDIGDDDEEEESESEEDEGGVVLEQKSVPSSVFVSAVDQTAEETPKPMGALERLRAKKQ